MRRLPQAIVSSQLLVLPWCEGIERNMTAANLHQFEDVAAYIPSGHRFSVPGVFVRFEGWKVGRWLCGVSVLALLRTDLQRLIFDYIASAAYPGREGCG